MRCNVVWNYREVNLFKFVGFLWISVWILFYFALSQVWNQVWKQDCKNNCKNCKSLERSRSGKHESAGEIAIPKRAQYKGLPKDRGLSNSRGLPSGRGLLNGCGRSRSIGNDSIRNENDNRENMNFLERMAASLTKNVANPRGPILTGQFSWQVILSSANLSWKC